MLHAITRTLFAALLATAVNAAQATTPASLDVTTAGSAAAVWPWPPTPWCPPFMPRQFCPV